MSARDILKVPIHYARTFNGPTVVVAFPDGHLELGEGFEWKDAANLMHENYHAALDHQEKMREDFFDSCEKVIKSLSGR